ncbi:MAG: arylsulfatase [Opitutaceae bacterium]|nr:arylsulfatase [Opitutaceae bacterium]
MPLHLPASRRLAVLVAAVVALATSAGGAREPRPDGSPVNVVLILADDLGYGEVGYQGQKLHRTPNLDRLSAEGIRFSQHYAGSAVCAPSRCTLLTGRHTGHARIRDNVGLGPQGEEVRPALQPGDVTVADVFRRAGYATGCFGKWGQGDEDTPGVPWLHGFDQFFGFLHNTHGTRYYTEFIYRNAEKVALRGNYGRWRKQYSPELIFNEAVRFLEQNRDRPFFLYYPFNLVHGDFIAPPAESDDPPPPAGVTLSEKERNYLAMVRRMDRDVGRLVARIDALGLGEKTLILFASDNGAKGLGEPNDALLAASGGFRGGKADLYEGGIRVPMFARWKGAIAPGRTTDLPSAFWDFLPTVCALIGQPAPAGIDGESYLPTLLDQPQPERRSAFYWELAKRDEPQVVPKQAVRSGPWKLLLTGDRPPELYRIDADPHETRDLAAEQPAEVARLRGLLASSRTDDPLFPLKPGPGFE